MVQHEPPTAQRPDKHNEAHTALFTCFAP